MCGTIVSQSFCWLFLENKALPGKSVRFCMIPMSYEGQPCKKLTAMSNDWAPGQTNKMNNKQKDTPWSLAAHGHQGITSTKAEKNRQHNSLFMVATILGWHIAKACIPAYTIREHPLIYFISASNAPHGAMMQSCLHFSKLTVHFLYPWQIIMRARRHPSIVQCTST